MYISTSLVTLVMWINKQFVLRNNSLLNTLPLRISVVRPGKLLPVIFGHNRFDMWNGCHLFTHDVELVGPVQDELVVHQTSARVVYKAGTDRFAHGVSVIGPVDVSDLCTVPVDDANSETQFFVKSTHSATYL